MQEAIKGMINGTIKPEDVKIDGIDMPEDIERKEVCNSVINMNFVIHDHN